MRLPALFFVAVSASACAQTPSPQTVTTPAPATQASAPQAAATSPPACAASEHRAFDFWLGEWKAYVTGTDQLAGLSTITLEDGGCVITEHWRSQRSSFTGRSLNLYDAQAKHWEQFWVDSSGDRTTYIGNPIADGMQLVAEDDVSPGQAGPFFSRMTFTHNADGSVRQHGETSTDRGKTWTDSYDFTYRRAG